MAYYIRSLDPGTKLSDRPFNSRVFAFEHVASAYGIEEYTVVDASETYVDKPFDFDVRFALLDDRDPKVTRISMHVMRDEKRERLMRMKELRAALIRLGDGELPVSLQYEFDMFDLDFSASHTSVKERLGYYSLHLGGHGWRAEEHAQNVLNGRFPEIRLRKEPR